MYSLSQPNPTLTDNWLPGTSSIVDEKTHHPLLSTLSLIVETAARLRQDGHRVIIVSSGAIGVGLRRMDVARRPKHLAELQALAAIGQCRLMSMWDELFGHLRQPIAQILLTRNDISDVCHSKERERKRERQERRGLDGDCVLTCLTL